jgi:hypothetical protein
VVQHHEGDRERAQRLDLDAHARPWAVGRGRGPAAVGACGRADRGGTARRGRAVSVAGSSPSPRWCSAGPPRFSHPHQAVRPWCPVLPVGAETPLPAPASCRDLRSTRGVRPGRPDLHSHSVTKRLRTGMATRDHNGRRLCSPPRPSHMSRRGAPTRRWPSRPTRCPTSRRPARTGPSPMPWPGPAGRPVRPRDERRRGAPDGTRSHRERFVTVLEVSSH